MDIIQFLSTRRTYRKFRQTPIPDETVNTIMEAARLASCSVNKQELRYITVQQSEMLKQIHPLVHWAALLPPEQASPSKDQLPVLYTAILAPQNAGSVQEVNIGLAIGNMITAAWSCGVGSCILGSIHRKELSHLLQVPSEYKIAYLVAFGYPDQSSKVVDADTKETPYSMDADGNLIVPKLPTSELILKQL